MAAAAAADSDPAAAVAAMSTCAHWSVLGSDYFFSFALSLALPGSLFLGARASPCR